MDPTTRFSTRVDDYVKYRPNYPTAVVDLLKDKYGLNDQHEIADVGAGVGHSCRLLAPHVSYIYGIEPNHEMYLALQAQMQPYSNFVARQTSAENTDLEARSVDFIVCGQSYHWFDQKKSKTEFERILNDEGYIVLLWNTRDKTSEYAQAYEEFLLEHGTDYKQVDHLRLQDEQFNYLMSTWKKYEFPNSQIFDKEGLIGRFNSSSYAPVPGTDVHKVAAEALGAIFDRFVEDNQIEVHYTTEVIIGKI